jgi:ATP-dependent helicase/nuclease subunit A
MDLRPKQEAAVKRSGQDVCVVAGPGSGKTRVLVERFCWLVREQGISPLRVLAITFTDKAATEIKQRLAKEFSGQPGLREQVERAYVSTVHGFCMRLLKENSIAAGLDPDFTVMDAPESAAELRDAANLALDRLNQERAGELRGLLDAVHASTRQGGRQPDIAEALTSIYEAMRTAGKSVSELRQASAQPSGGLTLAAFVEELRGILAGAPPRPAPKQKECIDNLHNWAVRASALAGSPVSKAHFELLNEYPPGLPRGVLASLKHTREERLPLLAATLAGEYYAPLKGLLLDALALTDQLYRQRKRELGTLDFSDLEEQAIELLRANPAVRDSVRDSFDQVLMDELQDTNPLQWELVNLLRSANRFFAVGDINQSIFGFRHADPGVFLEYRRAVVQQGGEVDELNENFRSRGEILAAAEAVAGDAGGVEPRRLEPLRPFGAKPESSVEVIVASGEEAVRVESHWIARRIRDLVGSLMVQEGKDRQRPARFRDIAVLVRTLGALPPILEAFQAFGVPYLTEGGKTFYETREVRDLVLMLRVIANPMDEIALAGVLRSPLVGIGDETLLRMKQSGALRLDSLEALSCDPDDLERLHRFAVLIDRMRAERDDISPDRLLLRVIDDCDYEGGLDFRGRANLDKFLALVRDSHHGSPRPLEALIEDLAWLRSSESEAEAPPDDSSDVVRVMTIHKAKGLEFPIVFLPALHRGVSRMIPPICLSREGRLGLCWRNPSGAGGLEDLSYRRHRERSEELGRKEEDRLLYVAMTRAEEHLVLSFAQMARPKGSYWRMVTEGLRLDAGDTPAPVRLLRTDQLPEMVAQPAAVEPRREGPMLLVRPTLADQHDSAASVTSVDIFALCPRRYYLGRYIGWQGHTEPAFDSEPAAEPGGVEFGSLVHDLLAGAAADGPVEALELVSRFQSSELGKRVARAGRAEREFDFVMALEDVVLSGQIDLWFEEGGELILVDYKTDRVRPEAVAAHAELYAVQLRLYALALERITGRLPDQALVCLLRPGQAVPVALDVPLLDEARNLVRSFREAQSSLRFEMHAGEHCARCPFYGELCLPDIFFSSAPINRARNSSDSGSGSMPL